MPKPARAIAETEAERAGVIRRRFFERGERQLHYREGGAPGAAPTLVLLHLLPASSRHLVPLMEALAPRHVVAPDLPGLGDSDALDMAEPAIADLAADLLPLIDALDAPVDLYGTHTGACVAVEIAARHPGKVRRLVIDGVPIFDAQTAARFALDYAPAIVPDHDGTHLLRAHGFARDMHLFFPWFDKSAAAARGGGLPDAAALFAFVMDVLKGLSAIPAAYRAAFAYPTETMLAQVPCPTLCLAQRGDTLAGPTRRALELLPFGRLAEIDGDEGDKHAVAAPLSVFLDEAAS